MRLTSATLDDVWPDPVMGDDQAVAVSARVSHVVSQENDVARLHAVIDSLHQEMTQRARIFIAVIVVLTLLLMRRIGRLEQRVMIQAMGVPPQRPWW